MIVSKRDTSSIYNGCLAYLKNDLNTKLPEGQNFNLAIGIKGLVGSRTQYNAINTPYNAAPAYFEIYFGDKYIFPTAYSLMGRRDSTYKVHYLKSWDFFGRDENGVWNLLHTQSNKAFSQAEERTYPLKFNKSFNAFKIQMTSTNTAGEWALCLGQIEVFGDIYKRPFNRFICTKQISRNKMKLLIAHLIIQIIR